MDKPQFTPGPWTVGRDGFNISDICADDGTAVASIYGVPLHTRADQIGDLNPERWGEGLANARLIAAAPELYAALVKVIEYDSNVLEDVTEVSTALAKVRG